MPDKHDKANYERVEKFLIEKCGYKSIGDAILNTPKVNLYPIYGDLGEKVNGKGQGDNYTWSK